MSASSPTTAPPSWSAAVTQPGREFPLTPLPLLEGEIPPGLRGTLYRNGPGRLERGGARVGHWFDGDGAILAVRFSDGGATGVYRYVQTQGYREESAAGRFLYPGFGMRAPGPFWKRWGKFPKHCANTSVLALPDKLLALWEGGHPYGLDLETLETLGLDSLSQLEPEMVYSAHPKVDGATGEIFNFGVSPGPSPQLHLYKSDRNGTITQQAKHPLQSSPVLHDFAIAGPYLVFFIPPVEIQLLPILFGYRSFADSLKWQPSQGTQILIFDRHSLELVSQSTAESWYQWHFSNGFVDDRGSIIIDFARYDDFQTNEFLREVASGKTKTAALSRLWRSHLNPKTGELTDSYPLVELSSEFPSVAPSEVGNYARYTYLSVRREGTSLAEDLLDAIARWDDRTQTLEIADPGSGLYPTEPIYVTDLENSDRGWLLTVVYCSSSHTSEVWVYDAARLSDAPVCRLQLPSVIPIGFHGTWKAQMR
ncbi:carotenoid oxygenase family protein [Roseofilum casamattae]|uniref:Carotenoid oxygenase family protein n=1 Tax=Roseofilum casamattae BLCC-M143 TaxID=3022442 RepID=A0ABT7BS15_9CYAN|nr:carotenoid oxygenase family protein [Roseofilum casamattae]MDJ1181980.1 carotenoid oxygenase family protein [Roseofilum casamattae BLCC-M143]